MGWSKELVSGHLFDPNKLLTLFSNNDQFQSDLAGAIAAIAEKHGINDQPVPDVLSDYKPGA